MANRIRPSFETVTNEAEKSLAEAERAVKEKPFGREMFRKFQDVKDKLEEMQKIGDIVRTMQLLPYIENAEL